MKTLHKILESEWHEGHTYANGQKADSYYSKFLDMSTDDYRSNVKIRGLQNSCVYIPKEHISAAIEFLQEAKELFEQKKCPECGQLLEK